MTDIVIIPKWTDVKPSGNYVYLHRRLSDGSPMYVGKGAGNRGWQKNRSDRWLHSARKHGVSVEILQDNMSESDAFLLEMWIISELRHKGERIINLTDGGEGATGAVSHRRKPVYCSNGMLFDCADYGAEWLRSVGNYGATSKIVSSCALGRKKSIYGYAFSYESFPPKPIFTGREAQGRSAKVRGIPVYSSDGVAYPSATAAAESIGCGSGCKILMACRGERLTAYGLTWSFSPDGPFPEYVSPMDRSNEAKKKRVMNDSGDEFNSFQDATSWLSHRNGVSYSPSAIHQSIKRGQKCGGYKWFHIDKFQQSD